MQVPHLSSSNTTRRPLNLKNTAIWASQPRNLNLKTAPQDANVALEFRNHNRAPSRPQNAAPEFIKHNQPPSRLEKYRPLSFPTKDSEPENGAPRCKCCPWIPQPKTGALWTCQKAALWASNQVRITAQDANAASEFCNHNRAPSKPKKCRPLNLQSGKNVVQRWKYRPCPWWLGTFQPEIPPHWLVMPPYDCCYWLKGMDIGASAPSAQERPLSLGRGSEPRSPPPPLDPPLGRATYWKQTLRIMGRIRIKEQTVKMGL